MNPVDELNFLLGIGPPRPKLPTSLQKRGYTSVRTLGKGSFGQALLIFHTGKQQYFVAKHIILTNMSERQRKDAYNEIAVLQKLEHPNIVRYVECCEEFPNLYIIMEYADGGDLYTHLNKIHSMAHHALSGEACLPPSSAFTPRPLEPHANSSWGARGAGAHIGLTEPQVISLFFQILMAVTYMHRRRLLHRDIKSHNIFLTRNHVVKLGDFGITTVLQNTVTMASTLCGTPCYFSPELCQGKPYNNKSDIWALGVLLYELCAGKMPFESTSMKLLMREIVNKQPPRIPASYSEPLWQLVQSMLRKDPAKRPDAEKLLLSPVLMQRLPDIMAHLRESERQVRQERERCEPSGGGHDARSPRARGEGAGMGEGTPTPRYDTDNDDKKNPARNHHARHGVNERNYDSDSLSPPTTPPLLPSEQIVESDPYRSMLVKQRARTQQQDNSSVYHKVNIGWCTSEATHSAQGRPTWSSRPTPTSGQNDHIHNPNNNSNNNDNSNSSEGVNYDNCTRGGVNPFHGALQPSPDTEAGYRSGIPFLRRAAPHKALDKKEAVPPAAPPVAIPRPPNNLPRAGVALHASPASQSPAQAQPQPSYPTRVTPSPHVASNAGQRACEAMEKALSEELSRAPAPRRDTGLPESHAVARDVILEKYHQREYMRSVEKDTKAASAGVTGGTGAADARGVYVMPKTHTSTHEPSISELLARFDREKKRIRARKTSEAGASGQEGCHDHTTCDHAGVGESDAERQSRAALRQLPRHRERTESNDCHMNCHDDHVQQQQQQQQQQRQHDSFSSLTQAEHSVQHTNDSAVFKQNCADAPSTLSELLLQSPPARATPHMRPHNEQADAAPPFFRDAVPPITARAAGDTNKEGNVIVAVPRECDETELDAMLREMTIHVKQFESIMSQSGESRQPEETRVVRFAAMPPRTDDGEHVRDNNNNNNSNSTSPEDNPLPCVTQDTRAGETNTSNNRGVLHSNNNTNNNKIIDIIDNSSQNHSFLSRAADLVDHKNDHSSYAHHSARAQGGDTSRAQHEYTSHVLAAESDKPSQTRACHREAQHSNDTERAWLPPIHTPPVLLSESVSFIAVPVIANGSPGSLTPLDAGEPYRINEAQGSMAALHSSVVEEYGGRSCLGSAHCSLNRRYTHSHALSSACGRRCPNSVVPTTGPCAAAAADASAAADTDNTNAEEDVALCGACLCGRVRVQAWLYGIYGSFLCSCVVCARVGKSSEGVEWLHLPDMPSAEHLLPSSVRHGGDERPMESKRVYPLPSMMPHDTHTEASRKAVVIIEEGGGGVSNAAEWGGDGGVSVVRWHSYTFAIPVAEDKDTDATRADRLACDAGMCEEDAEGHRGSGARGCVSHDAEAIGEQAMASFTIYFCPTCGTQVAMRHDHVEGVLLSKTSLEDASQSILAQYAIAM